MYAVRLYRLGSRVLPRLPEPLIYALCELLGLLVLLGSRKTRRAVLGNLQRAARQRRGLRRLLLAQQVIANVLKHYADLLRLPQQSAASLEQRMELYGLARLKAVLDAGRGAIVAVAHSGSYSQVVAYLADCGWKVTLVVERLQPPETLEVLNGLRRRENLTIVPLGAEAGRELLRALRRGEMVVLAADRDLAGQYLVMPFFGEPARIPAGPAALACRGVPLFTAFTARLSGGRSLGYVEPLPHQSAGEGCVEAVAQQIVKRLEDYIRRFPESWGVLQPVWPACRTKSE